METSVAVILTLLTCFQSFSVNIPAQLYSLHSGILRTEKYRQFWVVSDSAELLFRFWDPVSWDFPVMINTGQGHGSARHQAQGVTTHVNTYSDSGDTSSLLFTCDADIVQGLDRSTSHHRSCALLCSQVTDLGFSN